uniref:NADH-ubiquinone oxidoreductase chain 6 n=1 Tax=Nealotus tripes TaxID=372800 RepID=T2HUC9_9SCOM|nr:NADH dehydrogenase subunit 6 [Nealotus tripes]WMY89978.1 NADH dehydrogenase subunit 6 [Nealotus tripes]WNH17185.1 NADH dehydrogenase subunit 6 [Nealotus tripes]BAN83722.1 NADH dehydrogenase subunit 6 [Nealotus tripes]
MTIFMCLLLIGLIVGYIAVASNPAPYFAALGLVVVAGMGCGVLLWFGGSFLSLVLFLIYLGGMMVVFAYSSALAAEPHPEGLGSWAVGSQAVAYGLLTLVLVGNFVWGWFGESWTNLDDMSELSVVRGDTEGVALMYSAGGGLLLLSGWVLLLTLLVVLELVRGVSRGTVRAV